MNIVVSKVEESRIKDIDINDVEFGKVPTDHMIECDFVDGKWGNVQIKPFHNFSLSPLTMSLHYGQTIFEGMKAYKSPKGESLLFRPLENIKRMNLSAQRMNMPIFPEKTFMEALKKLVDLDKKWIPSKEGSSMYIRPSIIATDETIVARPSFNYKFFIVCFPVGLYYSSKLKVKIETEYCRAATGGVGEAKCGGNYGGSFHPVTSAANKGYNQVIWTDESHQFLEEAGTMNLMFRIKDALVTPKLNGRILKGITRKSILQLAQHLGIQTIEKELSIKEIVQEYKDGNLKEAFGVGTAAIVSIIEQIDYQDIEMKLPESSEYANLIKEKLYNIQTQKEEGPFKWVESF